MELNLEQMKKYLKQIFELESKLYSMRKFQEELKEEIAALKSYPVQPRVSRNYVDYSANNSMSDLSYFVLSGVKAGVPFGFVGGVVAVFAGFKPDTHLPLLKTIFIYGPIMGGIIGILGGALICFLKNKNERNKMLEANREIDEKNELIDKKNREARETSEQKAAIVQDEIKILNDKIKEMTDVLDKYYSKNIIYPKYRNIIAISSFYEYFSSGRCFELEGHEGAYNIFESESRQNIIINKLDDVIRQLDYIQQNQFMLYSAIQEQNSKVNSLMGDMRKCVSSMQRVEASNDIIAYNSKISADCLEYFAWIKMMGW